MDLVQLHYFLSFVRTQNLSKSAEELNVSPSTISMALSRLEDELGVNLFYKQGREKRVTEAGLMYSEYVEKALKELETAKLKLNERFIKERGRGVIHLATEFPDLLTFCQTKYLKENPNVRIEQSFLPTVAIKQRLLNKETDFSLTYEPFYEAEIFSTKLFTEKMMLLVNAKHWAAKRQSISMVELKNEQFITMNTSFGFRKMTDTFCHQVGFKPKIPVEALDMQMLRTMVAQDIGISFISEPGWKEIYMNLSDSSMLKTSLQAVHILDETCKRTIYISYLRNRELPQSTWHFYNFSLHYYKQVEANNQMFRMQEMQSKT